MANLFKGVVYLTEDQYRQLKANGIITVGDITLKYDEDILYVTPDNISDLVKYQGTILEQAVIDITSLKERVTTLEGTTTDLVNRNKIIILDEGE